MRVYTTRLKTGISRTRGFEEKGLAQFAVNCGLKCSHCCCYCSTGAVLRRHKAFKELGLNPFQNNYAIVDPDTPTRVARDAVAMKERGLVELCTLVDAWDPAAQQYDLGRKCLGAILSQPGWTVRILTKNAAVARDFDIISSCPNRVLIGLSITATVDKAELMSIIEPNASSIPERMAVLSEAHRRGFRTYGMLCPLLPGIADSPDQIEELVGFAVSCDAEEVFVEPVNPRGPGLRLTQEALTNSGCKEESAAIKAIRIKEGWSQYATQLISNVQQAVRRLYDISRLRFLLYSSRLTGGDVARIKRDDAGVIWLGETQ